MQMSICKFILALGYKCFKVLCRILLENVQVVQVATTEGFRISLETKQKILHNEVCVHMTSYISMLWSWLNVFQFFFLGYYIIKQMVNDTSSTIELCIQWEVCITCLSPSISKSSNYDKISYFL